MDFLSPLIVSATTCIIFSVVLRSVPDFWGNQPMTYVITDRQSKQANHPENLADTALNPRLSYL